MKKEQYIIVNEVCKIYDDYSNGLFHWVDYKTIIPISNIAQICAANNSNAPYNCSIELIHTKHCTNNMIYVKDTIDEIEKQLKV